MVGGRSERDWVEETRARVELTVERHMLADVTVKAFLSGGVGSSAITAPMTRVATAPVTIIALALRLANHLGGSARS